jgi:hypothetical protein
MNGVQFVACDHKFVAIGHNDKVANIEMGGEGRFVLPPQNFGNFGSQPAQCVAGCIYNPPLTRLADFLSVWAKSFHATHPSTNTKNVR